MLFYRFLYFFEYGIMSYTTFCILLVSSILCLGFTNVDTSITDLSYLF